MRNLTLKTTLSALLVSVPLAGAFADGNREAAATGSPYAVDRVTTSSIGSETFGASYARQLDSQLNAAATNLQPGGRDNAVNPARAAQIRAEINAIRQAAAQERRANGGELSAASYQQLSGQVRALQQAIQAL